MQKVFLCYCDGSLSEDLTQSGVSLEGQLHKTVYNVKIYWHLSVCSFLTFFAFGLFIA